MSGGSVHAMSEAMPARLVMVIHHMPGWDRASYTGSSFLDLAVPVTISTS